MRTAFRVLFIVVALAGTAAALPFLPDFFPADDADRRAWRADLDLLETHLSTTYANFQWAAESDSVDLPSLHRAADSAISSAKNRRAARRAFRRLADAFGDGHLRVSPPEPLVVQIAEGLWRGGSDPIEADASAGSACRRMGYSSDSHEFGIAFDELPGFVPVATAPFAAGTVTRDGERIGVLRIASFREKDYKPACEEAWHARATVSASGCRRSCQDAIHDDVSRRLVASLARTLEQLESAGVKTLVVDVTGNGGGSGLADALARELSPRPLLASQVGVIRHTHVHFPLRQTDSILEAELANPDLAATQRSMLDSLRDELAGVMQEVQIPCDLSPLWRGEPADCRQLVTGALYSTGPLSYAEPGALEGVESASWLFHPAAYGYREGVYTGQLVVVMDRWSASATELFVALLRDNDAATLVGERTMGAGCGYTNGGVRLELRSVELMVRAPDCARLRASGENERAGVEPDVVVEWEGMGDEERARVVAEEVRRKSWVKGEVAGS